MPLSGKVAIITGAASGIGRRAAEVFAGRGASVVVADVLGEAAEDVAAGLTRGGLSAAAVTADMADEQQIMAMVDLAVATYGGLDVLYNNAAAVGPDVLAKDAWIVDLDAELFERVLRVNVVGPMLAAKHSIPHMLSRGRGVIINTASAAGALAQLSMPMYGVSKAAVIGMTRNIATQYSSRGIRAVGISPGLVVTGAPKSARSASFHASMSRHTLTSRVGTPDDVAYLAAFLASEEADYITGVTVEIDGGLTSHLPTYADERAESGPSGEGEGPSHNRCSQAVGAGR